MARQEVRDSGLGSKVTDSSAPAQGGPCVQQCAGDSVPKSRDRKGPGDAEHGQDPGPNHTLSGSRPSWWTLVITRVRSTPGRFRSGVSWERFTLRSWCLGRAASAPRWPLDSGPAGRTPGSRRARTQSGLSYLVTVESFSHRAGKQGLCSGSLCQHASISLWAVGGHSGGQGMRYPASTLRKAS